jgi:hypothetical protein
MGKNLTVELPDSSLFLQLVVLAVMQLDDVLLVSSLARKRSEWKVYIYGVCLFTPSILKMTLPVTWFSHPLVALLASSMMLAHCVLDIIYIEGVSHVNVISFGVIFTLDSMVVASVTGVQDMSWMSIFALLLATLLLKVFAPVIRKSKKKSEMAFWMIAIGISLSVFCEGFLRWHLPHWEPIAKTTLFGLCGWFFEPQLHIIHCRFRRWAIPHFFWVSVWIQTWNHPKFKAPPQVVEARALPHE